jgi:hypothetical protein
VRCEQTPADKVASNITLHFCLLKKRHCHENPAIRGGYGYHGQTGGVRIGCGFLLLKISWPWNNQSKYALILGVVHAWVGQKLLKYYIFKSCYDVPE